MPANVHVMGMGAIPVLESYDEISELVRKAVDKADFVELHARMQRRDATIYFARISCERQAIIGFSEDLESGVPAAAAAAWPGAERGG